MRTKHNYQQDRLLHYYRSGFIVAEGLPDNLHFATKLNPQIVPKYQASKAKIDLKLDPKCAQSSAVH